MIADINFATLPRNCQISNEYFNPVFKKLADDLKMKCDRIIHYVGINLHLNSLKDSMSYLNWNLILEHTVVYPKSGDQPGSKLHSE